MGDLPDFQTRVSTGDDDILFSQAIAAGGQTPVLDVANYTSLQVFIRTYVSTGPTILLAQWTDTAGDNVIQDLMQSYPPGFGNGPVPMAMPVRAPKVQLTNGSADAFTVTILGSQRPLAGLVGLGYRDRWGYVLASQALVAGTFYSLANPSVTVGQGLHQVEFTISNSAVTGWLLIGQAANDTAIDNMRIADSAEGHIAGGITVVSKQVILPAGQQRLRFLCGTSGTASVSATFSALGH